FFERALKIARDTLNSPKPPKPFVPTAQQRLIKEKNDEIERRLHGPKPLPEALPPADDAEVDDLLAKRGVISRVAREQVTDRDVSRLKPCQWLNDEIINFYGQMILSRSEECVSKKGSDGVNGKRGPKSTVLDVHYFSTFFWPKLLGDGYEKGRLAKWTKKFDIFTKDVILIPANHNNAHWTAAAINFRRKRFESYDSMGMARSVVFKALRQYVDLEHRNKKKKPFDFTGWIDYAPDDTPQQENGFDCGVFTCQFLESTSRGQEVFNFSQHNMSYLRRRMIWEIGHGRLRSDS
ncbi:cysteine proteinase, partial [Auriscalpium vulgare]